MMVTFNAIILKFGEMGEKTGWTYIDIPADIAQQLKPGNRKSFRVKGRLDDFAIQGVAVMPMGDGKFILVLNAEMRKGIHKRGAGALLQVNIEEDTEFVVITPDDLHDCLADEPEALEFFEGLVKSHRNYFIKWIDSAKTEPTRAKRIAMTMDAMLKKWDYSQMIKASQNKNERLMR